MPKEGDPLRTLVALAAVTIVLAGLHEAAPIVIPIVTAAIVATIAAPLQHRLIKRGLHPLLAFLATMAVASVGVVGVFWVVDLSLSAFIADLPSYRPGGQRLLQDILALSDVMHVDLSRLVHVGPAVQSLISGADALTRALLTSIAGWAVVLVLTVFLLFEALGLRAKVEHAFRHDKAQVRRLEAFGEDVGRYMGILTFTSALTGVVDFLFLFALGIPSALLWGGLAFLFSYIPSVGFIATVIPPVIATLVRFGFPKALLVLVVLTAADLIFGTVLFPRLVGQGLDIAPFWVILSLVFWGWLLGPAGAILAIPLTMLAKFLLDSSPRTAPLGYLMSTGREPPDE